MEPDDAPAWEREIRALEEEGRRAFLAQDLDTLRRLWSDEFLVNSPLNQVNQKDQVLTLLRLGRIRHLSVDAQIEQVRRHGDVVIVMGQETVADPPDGKTVQRRYTNIWRNEAGVWRTIGRHANIICPTG
jgi:ketosteroid isomerase-like protein